MEDVMDYVSTMYIILNIKYFLDTQFEENAVSKHPHTEIHITQKNIPSLDIIWVDSLQSFGIAKAAYPQINIISIEAKICSHIITIMENHSARIY